jgi:homogentisate 1,2-dioxygenase
MGLIYGRYDAKPDGFVPGGMSLHNCMLPHGPDASAFDQATNAPLEAKKLSNTLAFMFETRYPQHLTKYAAESAALQVDYANCWKGLVRHFDGTP